MVKGIGTIPWKNIPGLWTKDFTYRPEANDSGYSFYVWTNKKDLNNYLEGEVWPLLSMSQSL